ncbi:HK97 gp10 family phage protein [Anaerotignum sp. MB30-C6]|uniref:HK97 gp10 family phage protein n=1 Tax=Anaerotignum sp. MB30-C6 TaxID=3070814 RepID=UPI0027DD8FF8|nr:HK97 gp10 family phage protein [Anaerotignum sp. MB30-C6]WMI82024.1 HK97 gp10 family phage protein [Anaerotignum sp. MB30-C6]
MASLVKVGYLELAQLRDRLEKLQQRDLVKFQESLVTELAERLLKKAAKRTPTGLRESWTLGSVHYANGYYEVEVYNNGENASNVEFGYRREDNRESVPGCFMLRISEKELEQDADKIVEGKLMKLLRGAFHD